MENQEITELYNTNLISVAKQGMFDVIVHGCNCFNVMNAGLAKQIKHQFPEAWEADQCTVRGDITKLGNFSFATIELDKGKTRIHMGKTLDIINAYIQFNYGLEKVHIDYEALTLCMRKINHLYKGQSIGLPKIGSGLAQGDWNKIKDIIKTELKDMRVTLVYL